MFSDVVVFGFDESDDVVVCLVLFEAEFGVVEDLGSCKLLFELNRAQ
jgi:hypothetical protein